MPKIMAQIAASPQTSDPFDEFMTDEDYQRHRGFGPRAAQYERQHGLGPPYVKMGKRVIYRKSAVARWLCEQERHPPRRRAARTARAAAAS
jgi:hypothetical protein